MADTKLGHALTRAIVDTIHEPFLVLDADLRIIVASRSFYHKFQTKKEGTQGHLLYEIGNGQYNAPALRHFLKNIIPDHTILNEYKISHDFPNIGKRTVLLSAREVIYENSTRKHMLVSIGDISGQELLDQERDKLYQQKDLMLKEMKHRMANSLQLIASILILKSDAAESAEVRSHLKDTHQRIMSIASVERFLDTTSLNEEVELGPYLTDLSLSLGKSIVPTSHDHPVEIKVQSQGGMMVSGEAISMGLITAELVINALKYAFPKKGGEIVISYAKGDKGWELKVSDNGVGITPDPTRKEGLGTTIVRSLAKQLHASVETKTGPEGTAVSVICRADSPVPSVMRGSSTN